jgi:putative serine protease PepD
MKKILVSILIALSLFSVVGNSVGAEPAKDPRNGIVRIWIGRIGGLVGSGFFLKDGYVVTNAHVVKMAGDPTQLYAVTYDDKDYKLTLVSMDETKDLALLHAEGTDLPYLDVAANTNDDGNYEAYTNTPYDFYVHKKGTLQKNFYTAVGDLSSVGAPHSYSSYSYRNMYSFGGEPGNSGSAVLNNRGEVAGVILAMMPDTHEAVGITLYDLHAFLSNNGIQR